MRSRQLQGRSPLFEEGIVASAASKKNIYKGILKKKKSSAKDVKKSKSSEKVTEVKEKAPKDKTPLKPGQARNIDTGRGVKITPAHQKNVDAYNAKKASKSSKNLPSVNLEENTFTPKKAVK
jgi:hypothetical protein